jgi:CubicO group peptidase (beta-lactamase class C family)
VVLLCTPQGKFAATYGTTLSGTTSPPRADTHLRIASNTKTMTAAEISQLAQEGKLSLGEPVAKYVRAVPNGDKRFRPSRSSPNPTGTVTCTAAPRSPCQCRKRRA